MKKCKMIVSIIDITGFATLCREKTDEDIYLMLDKFYMLIETELSKIGGRVVKFMGDSALIVFENISNKSAAEILHELKTKSRNLWQEYDVDCILNVKSDLCNLVCGEMGLEKRFDIVGNDLNNLFLRGWDK